MANKRQKKKQQKRAEELAKKKLMIEETVDTNLEEAEVAIEEYEKEMMVEENIEKVKEESVEDKEDFKKEIVEEKIEEESKKEIKTEEDFSERLDGILNQTSNDAQMSDLSDMKQKEVTKNAEKMANEYKDKEKFTMKDITKLMKNSGMSYRQIMQQIKAIGKATEEYAETKGDDFDRKEFLRKQMEQRLSNK